VWRLIGMKKIILLVLLCMLSVVSFGKDRVEKIIKKGYIRVGTTGDYKPFTYYNGDKYEGYDIEMAKLIGDELGVEVRFVPTTWKTLVTDLKKDKFDIAMGGISRNLSRKLEAELTEPYLTYGKTPIVRIENKDKYKSLKDIDKKGIKVGVNIGGTNEKFADANIKNAEIIKFKGNLEVVEAV
jgi:cyclohexadienyl dehydratase